MAHPLTHLTHGIPTRRPFHPAKTASAEGRALHVTDDTAHHLRYTSRAKREADVSLSHRCTMEHPMRRVFHPETNGVKASPHRHKMDAQPWRTR